MSNKTRKRAKSVPSKKEFNQIGYSIHISENQNQLRLKEAEKLVNQGKIIDALAICNEIIALDSNSLQAFCGRGICLKQLGMNKEALDCFTLILSSDPVNKMALYNLGLLVKAENPIRAIDTFDRLLTILKNETIEDLSLTRVNDLSKDLAELLTDYGTHIKRQGFFEEALQKYYRAVEVYNECSSAYYNIGVVYTEQKRYEEALEYYKLSTKYNPNSFEAYCNMGVIYKGQGNIKEAISCYSKSLLINPNFPIAKQNMAVALTDLGTQLKMEGNLKEGMDSYQRALFYNFQYPESYYNLGVAFAEMGRKEEAISHYQLCVHFNPKCCEAFNNMGVLYKELNNIEMAIQNYQNALAINPRFTQTLNNLGVIFTVTGEMEEAFNNLNAAIISDPTFADAHNNIGVFYRDEGEVEKAIESYERCLELSPNSNNAAQNRLLAMNYSTKMDISDISLAHLQWGKKFPRVEWTGDIKIIKKRQLRIGYISPDFFTHSVSYFIDALLKHHNKQICHVFCYSNVGKGDDKTEKLKSQSHEWREVFGLDSKRVAELIKSDDIDILVELTGHTAGNRLDVMALKPAPIQVSWIGYPNTTGLPSIDFRFTDEICDPINTEQIFSEKLIRLPQCFLCYTPGIDHAPVNLPYLNNGYITFGSFNNLAKINDQVISLWCEVMKRVPDSRFVVKSKPFTNRKSKERVMAKFTREGIDCSRIDLIPLFNHNSDHMQSYKLIDISLDTFPYSGTTTTCESLWMGVPVITLKGESHSQNVSTSILQTIGFGHLAASTKEEFIEIACKMACNGKELELIHNSLRRQMESSYLCDGEKFTRNLEQIYHQMYKEFVGSLNVKEDI